MRNLSVTLCFLLLFQFTSFGQMQKFTKQNPDSSYKVSFLLTNQNTQLFFWVSGSHLLQSKSTDGINWSNGVVVKDSVVSSDADPNEITGIVMNSGRIFLVFRYQYYYSVYSDNNGQTWSYPTKLITGTNNLDSRIAHNGSIIQTAKGKLILTYSKFKSGYSYIKYITSSDTGKTWSTEQILSNGMVNGSISETVNNKLILVYQNLGLFRSFSTDDGITWDTLKTSLLNDTTVNTPKVVKDLSGKLWLFYQKNIQTPFQGISQQDILYKTSSDGGLTWGAENNFTRYKGFDGYFNVGANGSKPLVSFSSDRGDSSKSIYQLWYGTSGITYDSILSPYLYKYGVSISGKQYIVDAYIDYVNNAPTVSFSRKINGVQQFSLIMYDDGTHGDTLANDKIYSCAVPGLAPGDILLSFFTITYNQSNSVIYNGPTLIVSLPNSVQSALVDVNRFKLPVDNNGVLADVAIGGHIGGGKFNGLDANSIILFCGGFYLTGQSNGRIWSNGEVSASRVQDYLAGKLGSDPTDPKNILYVVKSTDPPFGQLWQNWSVAVSQGAAFYDGNHDGIYNPVDLNGNGKWDPNEDRPDLLGDMTTWCVYNDAKQSSFRTFNDVNPQGIEIQQTVFAQKDSADLNNVIFIRYRLINKGTVTDIMDSVYFSSVNDADIGDSGANDLVGCDTLLNTGYTYHKVGSGDIKWGTTPPAETITLLGGPLSYIPGVTFNDINSNGIFDQGTDVPIDTAYSFGGPLIGKTIYPGAKNLNISSFFTYPSGSDPADRFQLRYYLNGKRNTGVVNDPCTYGAGIVMGGVNCANINPAFMFSGDPVSQTGWIHNVPADQRCLLNTGPFKLEKNKPVDIMVAYIVGQGSNYLNSITVAKQYAANTIAYYNANFPKSILTGVGDLPQVVNNFNLYQNYPNPFNPSTRIKYSVSTSSLVSMKIYNILGKEVAVLLNEQKNPGEYEITFNSSKYNLASGVYFYKLTAGGFTSVKKMMLLK